SSWSSWSLGVVGSYPWDAGVHRIAHACGIIHSKLYSPTLAHALHFVGIRGVPANRVRGVLDVASTYACAEPGAPHR
ncbi:MAG TPA: hypothetical protein PK066_21440, partial [Saprospiraceae bacterium]|nr:hypothetical protein [Saprospiraceae bacterium]